MEAPLPSMVSIGRESSCSNCRSPVVQKRWRKGRAVWGWCICLLLSTGLLFWLPCVMDDCYDVEIRCGSCQKRRGYYRS